MLLRKKRARERGLKALAGETVKFAKTQLTLEKTETALEKAIARENQAPPKTKIGKVRRRGEEFLRRKNFLVAVVLLSVLDCILILTELMLDIKLVTDMLYQLEQKSEDFLETLRAKYPVELMCLADWDISFLYTSLLAASINWNTTTSAKDPARQVNIQYSPCGSYFINEPALTLTQSDNTTFHFPEEKHQEHSEEDLAHWLHLVSVSILGVMLIKTVFKIFCYGKMMTESKLECFDAVVVFGSFVLDLVLIEGVARYNIGELVLFLALLAPWRVIRVVNSLVVVVLDHEHYRLKILYAEKKKAVLELKEAKEKLEEQKYDVEVMVVVCREAGIPDGKVREILSIDMADNLTYEYGQALETVVLKSSVAGAFSDFHSDENNLWTDAIQHHVTSPLIHGTLDGCITTDETNI